MIAQMPQYIIFTSFFFPPYVKTYFVIPFGALEREMMIMNNYCPLEAIKHVMRKGLLWHITSTRCGRLMHCITYPKGGAPLKWYHFILGVHAHTYFESICICFH